MKRFGVSLIGSILAFTAGLVTAQSWNTKSRAEMIEHLAVNVAEPCVPTPPPPPPAPVQSFTVTPPREFDFGQSGLKLVPERVQMKSESFGYDIDVSYPQILGIPFTNESKIGKVNQQIKEAATKLYQWPLNPALQLRAHSQRSVRNTVNFTYQIGLATDSFLSVNFIGYSYNGDVQRRLQDSFSATYDLTTGRQVKLSELFMPRSNYLHAISTHAIFELSKVKDRKLVLEALAPEAENFNVWQITQTGILFNFYGCRVAHCGEGELSVLIPYEDLKTMLVPNIPAKFKINYP